MSLVSARLTRLGLVPLLLACATPAPDSLDGTVVDLSWTFDETSVYWPTAESFVLEREAAGYTESGYYYAANRFRASEHGGTHLDAPRHFAEGRWTVDEIPLTRLIGSGLRVDVSDAAAGDRDYEVSVADLEAWEHEHGQMPDGSIVLLYTGYGSRWPDRKSYMGTDERGADAVAKLHFPGLQPAAARWLARERKVAAVGLDTPSIDRGQSTLFESHVELMKANIPVFENLARLDALPAKGFHVIALPMNIRGGSGAPLRAIAIVPKPRER